MGKKREDKGLASNLWMIVGIVLVIVGVILALNSFSNDVKIECPSNFHPQIVTINSPEEPIKMFTCVER
jgi:hypothetical protein